MTQPSQTKAIAKVLGEEVREEARWEGVGVHSQTQSRVITRISVARGAGGSFITFPKRAVGLLTNNQNTTDHISIYNIIALHESRARCILHMLSDLLTVRKGKRHDKSTRKRQPRRSSSSSQTG